jgi:hypothetical protein
MAVFSQDAVVFNNSGGIDNATGIYRSQGADVCMVGDKASSADSRRWIDRSSRGDNRRDRPTSLNHRLHLILPSSIVSSAGKAEPLRTRSGNTGLHWKPEYEFTGLRALINEEQPIEASRQSNGRYAFCVSTASK